MTETQHTEDCWAMPECTTCGLRKKPYGRDAGIVAANGYCGEDCEGYRQEPLAGHFWPGERNTQRIMIMKQKWYANPNGRVELLGAAEYTLYKHQERLFGTKEAAQRYQKTVQPDPQGDPEETIAEAIRRGTVLCPRCDGILLVDSKGNVTQCAKCGDEAFVVWNLFVRTV